MTRQCGWRRSEVKASKIPESGEWEGGEELTAKSQGGEGIRNADATSDISDDSVHGQTQISGDAGEPSKESVRRQ